MMNHSFNVEVAKKYGVDGAIIIENIYFWIAKNRANKKHFYNGNYWTYNSITAFMELFPYWSSGQLERIIKKLEVDGAILTGNYNKSKYDRTKWFMLTETIYCIYGNEELHFSICGNGNLEIEEPIPYINTDINLVINNPLPLKGNDERFDTFWKSYPKRIGKGAAEKSFSKYKPSAELLSLMLSAIKNQMQSEQWQKDNGQFIPNPATWLNQKRWEDEPNDKPKSDAWGYEEMKL